MEAKAVAKYIRVSPQKARLVIDIIRGKSVADAMGLLGLTQKAVTRDIVKVLKSAVANAENTKKLDVDNLYVKKAYVDPGPSIKRMHARAMGRGAAIRKRMSHITIVLGERA
ncbi:MAG: 50S ribosomal protein L22 [Deltaproteobacteria bacterium]|nr:50S ribosomal protein L22 [Deltaproteobacteria bacterium]